MNAPAVAVVFIVFRRCGVLALGIVAIRVIMPCAGGARLHSLDLHKGSTLDYHWSRPIIRCVTCVEAGSVFCNLRWAVWLCRFGVDIIMEFVWFWKGPCHSVCVVLRSYTDVVRKSRAEDLIKECRKSSETRRNQLDTAGVLFKVL